MEIQLYRRWRVGIPVANLCQCSLTLTYRSPCRHGRAEVPGLVPGIGPGHDGWLERMGRGQ